MATEVSRGRWGRSQATLAHAQSALWFDMVLGSCGASAQGECGTGLPEVVRVWGMAGVELSVCEALASIGKDGEKPADRCWVAFP